MMQRSASGRFSGLSYSSRAGCGSAAARRSGSAPPFRQLRRAARSRGTRSSDVLGSPLKTATSSPGVDVEVIVAARATRKRRRGGRHRVKMPPTGGALPVGIAVLGGRSLWRAVRDESLDPGHLLPGVDSGPWSAPDAGSASPWRWSSSPAGPGVRRACGEPPSLSRRPPSLSGQPPGSADTHGADPTATAATARRVTAAPHATGESGSCAGVHTSAPPRIPRT